MLDSFLLCYKSMAYGFRNSMLSFFLDQHDLSIRQPIKLKLSAISRSGLAHPFNGSLLYEPYFFHEPYYTFIRVRRFLEVTREALCPIRSRFITIRNTCHYDFLNSSCIYHRNLATLGLYITSSSEMDPHHLRTSARGVHTVDEL